MPEELKIDSQQHDLTRLKINWKTEEPGSAPSGKKFWKTGLILGMALLLAILAASYFFLNPVQKVEAVFVVSILPSEESSLLNASGYVVANRKASIASKGTGRLVFLRVKEGDRVKKGEILAQLENADMLAALARARANLNVARSAGDQARAQLNETSLAFQRGKNLLEGGLISKADFDALETRFLRTRADIDSSDAGIRVAQAMVRSAEVDVENTIIRAPFDGTVIAKNAEVGEVVAPFGSSVSAKSAVLTIADMSSLEVEADVSESNIEKIRPGQKCTIILDAYPNTRYEGIVRTIVPTADRAKATILTKIQFLNPDPKIFPEMSAKVSFQTFSENQETAKNGTDKPVVAVQAGAVISKDSRREVFLIRDQRVVTVPVEVGNPVGKLVEITRGLQPGDQVVINPPEKLTTGSKIQILSKE